MAARVTKFKSTQNFIMNVTVICYRHSQVSVLDTFSKGSVTVFILWLCPAFLWQDINVHHYKVSFAIMSQLTSLSQKPLVRFPASYLMVNPFSHSQVVPP
jgi:hypothetical protein